jgi:hypothetical protein
MSQQTPIKFVFEVLPYVSMISHIQHTTIHISNIMNPTILSKFCFSTKGYHKVVRKVAKYWSKVDSKKFDKKGIDYLRDGS